MKNEILNIEINGLNTYAFNSKEQMLDFIKDKKRILIALNVEKILKREDRLIEIINQNIAYADGIGVVLSLRKKGEKKAIKIPGVELWLDIIEKYKSEKTFFFIGGTQSIIEKTIEKIKIEFPGIKIAGYRNGFFKNKDMENLKIELIKKRPDIVFVGMGTPKQEYIMEELIKIHPALYQGLGGSFDIYAGNINRAPGIFISMGLEWLYRLVSQPKRIKRQIVYLEFMYKHILNQL